MATKELSATNKTKACYDNSSSAERAWEDNSGYVGCNTTQYHIQAYTFTTPDYKKINKITYSASVRGLISSGSYTGFIKWNLYEGSYSDIGFSRYSDSYQGSYKYWYYPSSTGIETGNTGTMPALTSKTTSFSINTSTELSANTKYTLLLYGGVADSSITSAASTRLFEFNPNSYTITIDYESSTITYANPYTDEKYKPKESLPSSQTVSPGESVALASALTLKTSLYQSIYYNLIPKANEHGSVSGQGKSYYNIPFLQKYWKINDSEYKCETEYILTEDVTAYLDWTSDPIDKTFSKNELPPSPSGDTATETYCIVTVNSSGGTFNTGGTSKTLTSTRQAEYTFSKWTTYGGTEITETSPPFTLDTYIYAQWNKSWSSTAATSITLPDEKELTRSGYTLSGFSLNGTTYSPGSGYTPTSTNSVEFTTEWTANKYNVTLNPNGGTIEGASSKTIEVEYGEAYSELTNPYFAGHYFSGWYTSPSGGDLITNTTICSTAKDSTLYAQWDALYSYKLKFDKGEASSSDLPPEMSATNINDTFKDFTWDYVEMKKDNAEWLGWSYSTSGDVITGGTLLGTTQYPYTINNSTPGSTETVTLYPVFKTNGAVRVYTDNQWKQYIPYVYIDNQWKQCIPYVYNGTGWEVSG